MCFWWVCVVVCAPLVFVNLRNEMCPHNCDILVYVSEGSGLRLRFEVG